MKSYIDVTICRRGLSGNAIKVLLGIAYLMKSADTLTGYNEPDIGAEIGLCGKTVGRKVRELERAGVLAVYRQGGNEAHEYRITL